DILSFRTIRIALCDDEPISIEKLAAALHRYEERNGVCFQILTFDNPINLLSQLETDQEMMDIALLDIQIGNNNGIKTAKQIHDLNENVIIIFVSNYDSYMQAGYEVNAFRYILKDQIDSYLEKNISAAIHELMKKEKQVFVYKWKGESIRVKFSEIIFFESCQRLIRIVTAHNESCFYGKLDNIEKELNDLRFIRCHKSFLINVEYIESTSNISARLKGEYSIPISRSKLSAVKRAQVWAMR
ncbi:MAG TPA: LytTR family DNA-binding domain-containing protein, partial [Clostridia bacterium]|nr:LytTR family DNA-binding domain-containing protein [Clostridia bacterium]